MRYFLILWILSCSELLAQGNTYHDCKAQHDSIDGMKVMMVTEEMARFRSGEREMMRVILDSLHYPKGQKPVVNSKIIVAWVVDTLGRVRYPCIRKGFEDTKLKSFESEIIRVVSQLKDWVPARHKGKKVPVLIHLPIIIEWDD